VSVRLVPLTCSCFLFQKYRDLAPQLKDPNNGELNVSLYLGRLVPDELVMMSLAALAPAALKDKRAKEAAWSREAARCDIGLDAGATDIFQCDVCKERRCTYFQMQTRGADEPMTIFVRSKTRTRTRTQATLRSLGRAPTALPSLFLLSSFVRLCSSLLVRALFFLSVRQVTCLVCGNKFRSGDGER